MPDTPVTLCLPARFSSLPALLAPLLPTVAHPDAPTLGTHTLLRAQTAVEELFANSIHHGYGGETGQAVWLTVHHLGNDLRVIYADAAPAYNPLEALEHAPPVIDDQGNASRLGGAGHQLVRQLADRCRYRRHEGRNELTLEFVARPPLAR